MRAALVRKQAENLIHAIFLPPSIFQQKCRKRKRYWHEEILFVSQRKVSDEGEIFISRCFYLST